MQIVFEDKSKIKARQKVIGIAMAYKNHILGIFLASIFGLLDFLNGSR